MLKMDREKEERNLSAKWMKKDFYEVAFMNSDYTNEFYKIIIAIGLMRNTTMTIVDLESEYMSVDKYYDEVLEICNQNRRYFSAANRGSKIIKNYMNDTKIPRERKMSGKLIRYGGRKYKMRWLSVPKDMDRILKSTFEICLDEDVEIAEFENNTNREFLQKFLLHMLNECTENMSLCGRFIMGRHYTHFAPLIGKKNVTTKWNETARKHFKESKFCPQINKN